MDILEGCGLSDPGSIPGRGILFNWTINDIEEIIFQMETSCTSEKQIKTVRNRLIRFSEEMCYSCNYKDIIKYLHKLKSELAPKTLRSHVIDIKRLLRQINAPIADKIRLPRIPKRRKLIIKKEHIQELIKQADSLKFKSESLRLKAAILLAATSGIRAMELYKLTMENVDLENRTVYLQAEITKDFEDRVTFFNEEAKHALIEYLDNVPLKTDRFFAECTMRKDFRKLEVAIGKTKLRMKHMRKFFSQQSDRLGMPTAIKKMLMGHVVSDDEYVFSSRDVDLGHYDFQDDDDLKIIYDRYWKDFKILQSIYSI